MWSSGWAVNELSYVGNVFSPNTNTYKADDYWSNENGDGNKFLKAFLFKNVDLTVDKNKIHFTADISSYDLDDRYSFKMYVREFTYGYDVGNPIIKEMDITNTGRYTLSYVSSVNINTQTTCQIGFIMEGLNANPETDWGSVTFNADYYYGYEKVENYEFSTLTADSKTLKFNNFEFAFQTTGNNTWAYNEEKQVYVNSSNVDNNNNNLVLKLSKNTDNENWESSRIV